MHVDLWGKYNIASINVNCYYLLLVDNTMCYVTVYFLKTKGQAISKLQHYFTYLHVRGIITHALQVDHGTEFINRDLCLWIESKGMEIQMTMPYSPSQNSIVECMNCTLVELAQAMLVTVKLPKFLWEPVVVHAAHI